jgi:hypothetical protein
MIEEGACRTSASTLASVRLDSEVIFQISQQQDVFKQKFCQLARIEQANMYTSCLQISEN